MEEEVEAKINDEEEIKCYTCVESATHKGRIYCMLDDCPICIHDGSLEDFYEPRDDDDGN